MSKVREAASLDDTVAQAFIGIGSPPQVPKLTVADVIEPALLDIHGAANYLALSVPSLRVEMHAGRLAAKKFGRKPVFELSELRRYAASLPAWEPR